MCHLKSWGEELGNFITKCLGLAWPWAAGNCLTAPQEERGLQLLKQQSHFPSRKLQVPWFTLEAWALIPSRASHRLAKSLLLSSGLLNKDLSKLNPGPLWTNFSLSQCDWPITQIITNTHSSIDKINCYLKKNQLILNLYTNNVSLCLKHQFNLTTQKS